MKILRTASLLLLIALTTTFNTKAKDGRKGHDQDDDDQGQRGVNVVHAPPGHVYVITDQEKRVIQDCVEHSYAVSPRGREQHHHRHLPPGLAKKVGRPSELPPDWEAKCKPGVIMPEPVYKECHPLPPEIVIKLPPPPGGTILVAVEGHIVRMMEKTRQILDIFNCAHL